MAWEAEVRVFGEAIVRRRFVRFAQRAVDARPAFRQVVGILRDAVADNFRTRGVAGGSRWRDLAPATRARKRRQGHDPRILRATGRLYNSLVGSGVSQSSMGVGVAASVDHIEEISADTLRWGSRVKYGVYHQSSQPRSKIPYRPPVALSQRRKREIAKALQRAIVEGERGEGRLRGRSTLGA